MMSSAGDLRGTWRQGLGSLGLSLLLLFAFRWCLFEPYVIPSGSMIPTLLIHDHIFVNKFAYGLRVPFTERYLWMWHQPVRGDVVVFRSVEQPDIFLVKRIVGLPGDKVDWLKNGDLIINDAKQERQAYALTSDLLGATNPEVFNAQLENLGGKKHVMQLERDRPGREEFHIQVPKDHFFMMGDNRDHSTDSRYWGSLPFERILGRASLIWLSCSGTLPDSEQVCDPALVRWNRLFKSIL